MPDFKLLHASLLISDLTRSRGFYEGLIGLVPSGNRPNLDFPGIWYALGEAQIHLICQPNPDPVEGRPAHGGRDRHTAIGVADWEGVRARLESAGVPCSLSQSGRRALFCRDPDGNTLELMPLT